jgi:hypothetical protein
LIYTRAFLFLLSSHLGRRLLLPQGRYQLLLPGPLAVSFWEGVSLLLFNLQHARRSLSTLPRLQQLLKLYLNTVACSRRGTTANNNVH